MTKNERLMQRILILTRQTGNLAGTISFMLRTPDDETDKKQAFLYHLKCDLGDLLLQTEMTINDLGLSLDEIKMLAYDRYDECKQEFKRKGKSQYFI